MHYCFTYLRFNKLKRSQVFVKQILLYAIHGSKRICEQGIFLFHIPIQSPLVWDRKLRYLTVNAQYMIS